MKGNDNSSEKTLDYLLLVYGMDPYGHYGYRQGPHFHYQGFIIFTHVPYNVADCQGWSKWLFSM